MRQMLVPIGIVALGLISRAMPMGNVLWDKYLGDALYAVLVYWLLRMTIRLTPAWNALASMAAMCAIEAFQLTGIPRGLLGRLLGTTFSWFDIVAYACGIAVVAAIDLRRLWWRMHS